MEWGEFQIDGRSARGGKQTVNESYAKALNSLTKEEALNILKEEQPRDYLLHLHNLSSNLDRHFTKPTAPYTSPFPLSSFINIPEELQNWSNFYFEVDAAARPLRYKSIIIEGPSRIGKTLWARSLGKHNYLAGHLDFNEKVYSNEAEYNILDDIKPDYLKLKHWKELIGAQSDWQSNKKYGKPVQIKGGIPSIILCNPGEGSSYKDFLDKDENSSLKDWTTANAIFITIHQPLFNTQV